MKPVNSKNIKLERGSVEKIITWRILGTLDTIIISWIIIGDFRFAVSIGGVELFTKMFLYYLHERLWLRIDFSRLKEQTVEYEI